MIREKDLKKRKEKWKELKMIKMEKRKAKDIRIKVRANKIIEELEINLRKRKIEIKDQDRMIRSMIKKNKNTYFWK